MTLRKKLIFIIIALLVAKSITDPIQIVIVERSCSVNKVVSLNLMKKERS